MKSLQIGLFLSIYAIVGNAQESYLLVSSGGGVTGTATVFKINRQGEVMKGQGLAEITYTEQGQLKKCAAKKYFRRAKEVMEKSPDFIHPGNMYTSLAVFDEGRETRITWGEAGFPVSEDARRLYSKINAALSRVTFKPGSPKPN